MNTGRSSSFSAIALSIILVIGALNILESTGTYRLYYEKGVLPSSSTAVIYLILLVIGSMLIIGSIVYIKKKNIGIAVITTGIVLNTYFQPLKIIDKPFTAGILTIQVLGIILIQLLALILLSIDYYFSKK